MGARPSARVLHGTSQRSTRRDGETVMGKAGPLAQRPAIAESDYRCTGDCDAGAATAEATSVEVEAAGAMLCCTGAGCGACDCAVDAAALASAIVYSP